MTRPSVAVVPFGARATDARAGAWGRQIARRVVERFADDPAVEAKPVFLVALPEVASEASYLVFGSTPDVALAAQYGTALGASHALIGTLRSGSGERSIEATLVDVAGKRAQARFDRAFPDGTLHEAEPALVDWLARLLAIERPAAAAAAANEAAYRAILEGMDEEVNATLLAPADAPAAAGARARAAERYLDALRADPSCAVAEERLLVLAAESLEGPGAERFSEAIETLTTIAPRSWRAHYLLGALRHVRGDGNGAVVAFEHSDALHPLRDADIIRLAELYLEADATASALARLRRIPTDSAEFARAQGLAGGIAAKRGDLDAAIAAFERALDAGSRDGATFAWLAQSYLLKDDEAAAARVFERSARDAEPSWELAAAHGTWLHGQGEPARSIDRYREALRLGAPVAMRLDLARALVAAGDRPGALAELDALLDAESVGEPAAHARRLRLGLRRRHLEERLERAGGAAISGPDGELNVARGELEQVIAQEPDLWEAHFALGLVARRTNDPALAERAFRRALELWPEQPDALHELGVALLETERTNEAIRMLDAAVRLRPDDAGYLADAGFAQLRAGNLNGARQRLTRASELDANDPITQAYVQELVRVEAVEGRPN
ncbi:MAG TPA: tetratricopeptide repeat protein [Candidatus Limnocylindria bacterium]|nr:tetratricopeptide repeat protein [Candidatus Limnocylindria bacterium]